MLVGHYYLRLIAPHQHLAVVKHTCSGAGPSSFMCLCQIPTVLYGGQFFSVIYVCM
jgi:hypothetical protein